MNWQRACFFNFPQNYTLGELYKRFHMQCVTLKDSSENGLQIFLFQNIFYFKNPV